jgi:acyl-CoA thioesterase
MKRETMINGTAANNSHLAEKIVQKMHKNDYFSHWLGVEILEMAAGRSVLRMTVRPEMLNGLNILHGGITYSLADTALAYASNSHGRVSVALNSVISYPSPAKDGDTLTAYADEISLTNKTGLYDITVKNQDNVIVAVFRGSVYRTSKQFFPNEE